MEPRPQVGSGRDFVDEADCSVCGLDLEPLAMPEPVDAVEHEGQIGAASVPLSGEDCAELPSGPRVVGGISRTGRR